ncbi:hypothetical protein L198_07214 [Cryptococcus wingfieldii CBS 7118]|uniref:Nodulin-like domain-containing protein n=1 Tax=Cryptococcus wingfieldii CBS 7118 TaxID=1295528 RepID=A0A1E3IE61_9TREE|nr:hypothetical protein L198_07214 [Cryptococcus wingfieldii CBS 7118]ODN86849.1 hypothetical protein L198_07214 [Cryptococcus wingfieldii CBS 7118]
MAERSRSPTVLYDIERPSSPSSSSDFSAILNHKRHWAHRALRLDFPRPVHVALTCISITASAIQANGVYCWGTYGPVVAQWKKLDGTEAQTIVVGGIVGVYLMAAPLGWLTDRYGPRVGSLISGCLSAAGYLSFAAILDKSTPETPALYLWLTAAFFLVGAATVGSYFACLTCASLSFPSHPTLSLSLPLSLIGLSSLAISSFSTLPTFLSPETHDLDPVKFLFFLGVLSPAVNLFGFAFLRIVPPASPHKSLHTHLPGDAPDSDADSDQDPSLDPLSASLNLSEHTPLLIGGPRSALDEIEEDQARGRDVAWGLRELIRDWKGFWVFGVLCALVVGPGEMVIASIGSILTSLLPAPTSLLSLASPNPLKLRNKHVFLLSLSSTLARLITGILADYLSPPPTPFKNPEHTPGDPTKPEHVLRQVKKVRLTRSGFAGLCAGVLAGVFGWGGSGWLRGESGLGVVSVGVGAMYGALFTLTPAIVSHHFGPTNFGLAWGMISYFAALGSVIYSYLYALLSTPGTETECHGPHCFRVTFVVCAVSCVVGGAGLALLGRRWKI